MQVTVKNENCFVCISHFCCHYFTLHWWILTCSRELIMMLVFLTSVLRVNTCSSWVLLVCAWQQCIYIYIHIYVYICMYECMFIYFFYLLFDYLSWNAFQCVAVIDLNSVLCVCESCSCSMEAYLSFFRYFTLAVLFPWYSSHVKHSSNNRILKSSGLKCNMC